MSNSKQNLSGSSVQPNDTIYLCNFRVSVDGEWLCLKVREESTSNFQEYLGGKFTDIKIFFTALGSSKQDYR